MAGETHHDAGEDGLKNAKRWLERSTRVHKAWTRHDRAMSDLLEFSWPHGSGKPFSFDLGGQLRGDELENRSFVAEIKNYTRENDLPKHYSRFLAACYVALLQRPKLCDNFFWISWSPFQATAWDRHTKVARVKKAVLEHRNETLGIQPIRDAIVALDIDRVYEVSQRLWLLTLSQKQESLVISDKYFREIRVAIAEDRDDLP